MHDTITIRPTLPKAKLKKISGGNLNKWINGLIEADVLHRQARAVARRSKHVNWDDFFDRPRRTFKSQADEIRKMER